MIDSPPDKKKRRVVLDAKLAAYRGVWVYLEYDRWRIQTVSLELLGEGRKLADALGVELCGVVLANSLSCTTGEICRQAFEHGADVCHLVRGDVLGAYRNQPYTQALTELVRAGKPEILLLGATSLGRDLAGSVATALETGLTADCTALAIDPEDRGLLATRPTFGGSLMCTIATLNYRPQMATVRPRVMAMPMPLPGRRGPIIEHRLDLPEDNIATKVLAFIRDGARNAARLTFADIIVAGGRGLGKPANFELVRALAQVLGAEVGATRPLVQAGWVEADRQVGQSGKTVRPRLYIAAGISGAVQHRVGMEGADCIVAINNDPKAPIFDFAHFGIVGDAAAILSALTQAFRQHLNAQQPSP